MWTRADGYADAVLDMLASAEAVAPSIRTLEIANVLFVSKRRNRLKEADSARFIELLCGLHITADNETADHALRENLSIGKEQEKKDGWVPVCIFLKESDMGVSLIRFLER